MEENGEDYPPSVIPQEAAPQEGEQMKEKPSQKANAFFWDILETVVFALAIFVIVYLFLAQPHQVQGSSMYPNFIDGEYILTNKISYRFENPQRGDVVIFKSPLEKDFIKRIVGLPNEDIKVQNGKVYINDKELPESYLPKGLYTQEGLKLHNGETLHIPENQYAMFGDNRPASYDSREFGFINKHDVIGKAWIIYWPFSNLGVVPHARY